MKKKTPNQNERRGEAVGTVGGILSGLTGLVKKHDELPLRYPEGFERLGME